MSSDLAVYDRDTHIDTVSVNSFRIGIYGAIWRPIAKSLLGDRYELLLKDVLRNKGPTADTLYPWNVVDYLSRK